VFNNDLRFGGRKYKDLQFRDLRELFMAILNPGKYEQFLTDVFFGSKNAEPLPLGNIPLKSNGSRIMLDVGHAQF